MFTSIFYWTILAMPISEDDLGEVRIARLLIKFPSFQFHQKRFLFCLLFPIIPAMQRFILLKILYITPTYILRNDQICLRSPTTKLGHHLQTHILSNLQITMILVVTDPRPHLACQIFPVGGHSRGHHPKAESETAVVVGRPQQRRHVLPQLLKTTLTIFANQWWNHHRNRHELRARRLWSGHRTPSTGLSRWTLAKPSLLRKALKMEVWSILLIYLILFHY